MRANSASCRAASRTGERARRTDTDYRCVIINFYNKTLYIHGAHDDGHGYPAPDSMYFFYVADSYADLVASSNASANSTTRACRPAP